MPILRDWMLHHPSAWGAQQAVDYIADTRRSLLIGMTPTAATIGTTAACGILLQVLVDLTTQHRVYAGEVLDQLVATAERIEALGELEGSARQ